MVLEYAGDTRGRGPWIKVSGCIFPGCGCSERSFSTTYNPILLVTSSYGHQRKSSFWEKCQ